MLIYLFLIVIVVVLLAGWFLRGTLLHELLHLPVYHYHLHKNHPGPISFTRHSFGDHGRQYFLHFPPTDRTVERKQVIIFYHGGGWSLGSPEMFKINAAFFASRGYHVFMPSYRRLPFFRYPEIREDLNTGFTEILQCMKKEGLEKHKVILGGMSAGGNLAALLAYDRAGLKAQNIDYAIFSGLILMGAVLDLSLMQATPLRWLYAGSPAHPDFAKASPITYLEEKETLPVLIIHGTHDGLVAYRSAEAFIKKISARQTENLTIKILSGGTHLDAGSWNFFDNDLRKLLVEWLEDREASS